MATYTLLGTINLSTMIRKRHFKWLKLVWKQNEASYWLKKGGRDLLNQSQILKKIEQKLITEEKLFLWRHEFRIEMA